MVLLSMVAGIYKPTYNVWGPHIVGELENHRKTKSLVLNMDIEIVDLAMNSMLMNGILMMIIIGH